MTDVESLLAESNEQQLQVIRHETGPLLVVAGPGSGKTRTLSHRLAYRVGSGKANPSRLLALTFTRQAAGELRERVQGVLGDATPFFVGTFHSMCHSVLRKHIHHLGYARNFRVLAPGERRRILEGMLKQRHAAVDVSRAASLITAAKNGTPFLDACRRTGLDPSLATRILTKYDADVKGRHLLDLDDLQCLTLQLLRDHESVRRQCRTRFDEILVDEYQDVNPVQQSLLVYLVPENRTVVAVGDDDQAIYGWRQADAGALGRFKQLFPKAQTVKLERTYRSTKLILRAAQALVTHNTNRIERSLYTERPAGKVPVCYAAADDGEEGACLAREIARLAATEDRPWDHFAVLYRTHAQSRTIEDAFLRHGIPYYVGGGSPFYQRLEVRLTVAFLRLVRDPSDEDAMSLLLANTPGIGERRLAALRTRAAAQETSLLPFVQQNQLLDLLPPAVQHGVSILSRAVEHVRSHRFDSLVELTQLAGAATHSIFTTRFTDPESAVENLGELVSLSKDMLARRATLRDMLARLSPQDNTSGPLEGVCCMTLHAAKGTEFPVVWIPGVEEGILPHRRSLASGTEIEEERRLCYVGMTRARDRLLLSYAHSRMIAGTDSIRQRSRFLTELGRNNVMKRTPDLDNSSGRLVVVKPGQRVFHHRWQAGTVVKVEGAGRETIASVEFDQVGLQRVRLHYSPLRAAPTDATHAYTK